MPDYAMYKLMLELPLQLQNKINRIENFSIDPVPGTGFDRGEKLKNLKFLDKHMSPLKASFLEKIHSSTFYSNTGGLNSLKRIKSYTPYFDALKDPINRQDRDLFVFDANHEEIAGVNDKTGSSKIIKNYIKARAKERLNTCYKNNENDFDIEYHGSDPMDKLKYRGFLDVKKEECHKAYQLNDEEIEFEDMQKPQDCMERAVMTNLRNDGYYIECNKLDEILINNNLSLHEFFKTYCGYKNTLPRDREHNPKYTVIDNILSQIKNEQNISIKGIDFSRVERVLSPIRQYQSQNASRVALKNRIISTIEAHVRGIANNSLFDDIDNLEKEVEESYGFLDRNRPFILTPMF